MTNNPATKGALWTAEYDEELNEYDICHDGAIFAVINEDESAKFMVNVLNQQATENEALQSELAVAKETIAYLLQHVALHVEILPNDKGSYDVWQGEVYLATDLSLEDAMALARETNDKREKSRVAELEEALHQAERYINFVTLDGSDYENVTAPADDDTVDGYMRPCDECNGSGTRENELGYLNHCTECDGTGIYSESDADDTEPVEVVKPLDSEPKCNFCFDTYELLDEQEVPYPCGCTTESEANDA